MGRKFSSTGKRAPGYRLSPSYFHKFQRMPAPDWAQKRLRIIVPNRRTVSPEFFSRYVLSAEPKAEVDNIYRDLDYSGYHENRI